VNILYSYVFAQLAICDKLLDAFTTKFAKVCPCPSTRTFRHTCSSSLAPRTQSSLRIFMKFQIRALCWNFSKCWNLC